MKCNTCSAVYHKTTCAGETRWRLDKLIKEGKPWSCKKCKDTTSGRTPTTEQEQEVGETNIRTEQVIPKKCNAKCGSTIRKGTDFLICSKCECHYHKQQKCSKMSRQQVESLNRSTWECLGCQETENDIEPTERQTIRQTGRQSDRQTDR